MGRGLWIVAVMVGTGCGGDGTGKLPEELGPAPGQVEPGWEDYCIAEFTRDYEVTDAAFGDEFRLMDIVAGDRFLLASLSFGGELLLMTPEGGVEIELGADDDDLPFTSDCIDQYTTTDVVTFGDVVVYADEGLSSELCTIPAGTVADGPLSFQMVWGDGDRNAYLSELEALAPLCGGATEGYASAGHLQVGEVSHGILPFASPIRLR